jgi:tetratricopeptide (TPR) repeat protein
MKRTLAREHNQLGVHFYRSGALDLALEQFKRATKQAPWVASYWLNLGVALLDTDALDDAQAALTEAVEINPQNQSAYFHLAQLKEKRSDTLAARELYRRAIELGSNTRLAGRARERLQGWQPRLKVS